MSARAINMSTMATQIIDTGVGVVDTDMGVLKQECDENFKGHVRSRVSWGINDYLSDDGTGTHSQYQTGIKRVKLSVTPATTEKYSIPTRSVLKSKRSMRLVIPPNVMCDGGHVTKRKMNAVLAINANLRIEIERLHNDMDVMTATKLAYDTEIETLNKNMQALTTTKVESDLETTCFLNNVLFSQWYGEGLQGPRKCAFDGRILLPTEPAFFLIGSCGCDVFIRFTYGEKIEEMMKSMHGWACNSCRTPWTSMTGTNVQQKEQDIAWRNLRIKFPLMDSTRLRTFKEELDTVNSLM
jgi:hypothetical protein